MPADGQPGPASPTVTDGRVSVAARTIQFSMATRGMSAETKVRSTILPQKKQSGSRSKLPSVLAQEAVGAVSGLVPALITLRGSRAAIWHAVEHKSIAAYEAGGPGEVPDAADHAKEHDRCGSNLVLPLLVTTTLANTVSRKLFPRRRIGVRAGMTLIGVGAAVEVFGFATRNPEHILSRTVHGFGHALQAGFATREPSAGDLLVGRAAMDALLRAEGADTE